MRRLMTLLALGVSVGLLALTASHTSADAPPGPFFQGFETSTSGWFDSTNGGFGTITRRPSGYVNGGYASGVSSAAGGFHARASGSSPCAPPAPCFGPFTRWGGYNDTFPNGGYRTLIDIYFDVGWAATHPDIRFDFSSAINNSAGVFLRDFVFNVGTQLSGPGQFRIQSSTNATRSGANPNVPCPAPNTPPNTCRAPAFITTSGWYTFRHTFRNNGGFLAVDFDIFPASSSSAAASWTIQTGDCFSPCVPAPTFGVVGGNRYGWFVNEEIPELAIDNSERTGLNISLTPATATNIAIAGSTHTVTATVTSTDADGHPSPGGTTIEFDVTSGPNAGQTSHPVNTGTCSPSNCATPTNCTTNCQVTWTYESNGTPGMDTIQACFPERSATVNRPLLDDARQCRTVTKVWAASTPGKVTGGGQIEGDPIFSPLGDLLSVPALAPSQASASGKATFGFVVKCCPATGNLEYNDHEADVRIKATSITGLLISNGSCGPNTHARFTGTADVIRSTGTTSESFTVNVDDCGEPGVADQFGIQTTTYCNPAACGSTNTLIGGNIQIHK
jgi:hypothetical protein